MRIYWFFFLPSYFCLFLVSKLPGFRRETDLFFVVFFFNLVVPPKKETLPNLNPPIRFDAIGRGGGGRRLEPRPLRLRGFPRNLERG